MIPGGIGLVGKFTGICMMTKIIVNGSSDDIHITHNAVFNCRSGTACAEHIGVAEIKTAVGKNSLETHCGINLAHSGNI